MIASTMQDLRYALRQLRRTPVFAVTAVITLALGIGANTAIFTVFEQVLLRALPVQEPQELVRLSYIGSNTGRMNVFGGDGTDYFSYPMYKDLRDKNTVFSGALADTEAPVGAVWKNQPELLDAELVSGNYFDVLGVGAATGRTLLASSENRFVWASLAHIHGIPGMPEWADWFAGELEMHQAIIPALGIGCAPVLVKGEKEQFLSWLSFGVESGPVGLPTETGSIRWPSLSLRDAFLPPN